ncbi:helix-turn-helix domain-containing protein [Hansschlegelia sp. KR7-227]|uniref:AraC family transcriptional regulator n=1 Tax=Hansschlegelia sp. KR7-227 TaxID=3400914 RepID=UPI003C0F91FE
MAAFRPKMTASRQGITLLGDGRAHQSELELTEVWRARCEAGAEGCYISLDPRLFVVLDPLMAELELDAGEVGASRTSRDRSVSYIPAGAPIRMRVAGLTDVRHLDLHFDAERLDRLGVARGGLEAPRLLFADERVQRLARLLSMECDQPVPSSSLYGDALVAALLAAAFEPPGASTRRSALSDRQLRLAVDHIEDRCAEAIRLRDLARLTGVSETYFSHAFKAATGMPPHRWQLHARVRLAQEMLARTDAPLIEIAVATGFSDQPHFTRVFRAVTGGTPSSWRAGARASAFSRTRRPSGSPTR